MDGRALNISVEVLLCFEAVPVVWIPWEQCVPCQQVLCPSMCCQPSSCCSPRFHYFIFACATVLNPLASSPAHGEYSETWSHLLLVRVPEIQVQGAGAASVLGGLPLVGSTAWTWPWARSSATPNRSPCFLSKNMIRGLKLSRQLVYSPRAASVSGPPLFLSKSYLIAFQERSSP